MEGIVFTGSTKSEQSWAKEFWKGLHDVDDGHLDKSATVYRIGQREKFTLKSMEDIALKRFWSEVEKQEQSHESEIFNRFEKSKAESQLMLSKRRQERVKREEISKDALYSGDLLSSEFIADELISKEEEVIDTLQGIEEFEERLKKQ